MCDHCGCHDLPEVGELADEHEEILRRAWRVAEATGAGRPVDPGELAALVDLLDRHAASEELGLYPVLAERGRLGADLWDQLEAEHRDLHELLANGRFDRAGYYALAAHIEVEECELFPLAMLGLDEDDWNDVAAARRAVHN